MAYNYNSYTPSYNYTVGALLHDAGRHRRHHKCGRNLGNCRCEDDHVIELRLVVDALNQLPCGTYTAKNWQRKLVDFFNDNHHNSMCLPHWQHKQKTEAVDKWLDGEEDLTEWIDEIREKWAESKDDLKGFGQFKAKLDDILDMDDYYD